VSNAQRKYEAGSNTDEDTSIKYSFTWAIRTAVIIGGRGEYKVTEGCE
jgi:hypothetical protein